MNKYFFAVARCLVAVAISASSISSASAGEVTLEDQSLRISFDSNSGALTRLEDKSSNWTIERRPELGMSFRLLAPLPDQRDNFILGQKQHADEVKKISDHEIEIKWNDLLSEHGGVLPIALTADVTLRNGALTFSATLENHSSLTVETIDYPSFGDLTPPSRSDTLQARTMWYGNLESDDLYPDFPNRLGYWGVDFPTKQFGSDRSLFCLIQSRHEGLYVEMADPTQPYLLEYTFEQHPGLVQSVGSLVPANDTFAGFPVHLEFRTCHFIFARPGSTTKLAPVIVRPYQGDWHAGVDCYKEWRATWFKPPHLPDWAREVHSWTMLRMNTPEEDYTIPYTNFVAYGEEYARYGVRAVQLVGWNVGGQDRDDPSQDIEPRLGTWQEFHDAIAKVQSLGVKVILFGKLNWADETTAWYTNELYKYQATDPFGRPYEQGGYSYVTPTQLVGINNRRRAIMDVLSPGYRDIATSEFQKILALGSAGWLWDELCHHGNALYNFAPDHGYNPPGYIYGGDLPLAARLRDVADKTSPDFIFSGEGQQDWLMQYFPVSETGDSPTPVCQYIDPHCLMLAGVSGFDDREKLNQILLHRYVIEYEPFFYKGHLSDFPLTMAYGKKIDDLRRRYQAYLWDGEYRDNLGASVTADGPAHYSVFVAANGKRAVVVVNPDAGRAITAKVSLPDAGRLAMATPEDPDAKPTDGTIKIPPRSAAVVLEQ